MIKVDKRFSNEADKIKFVSECELDFEQQLDTASKNVASDKNIHLITLAGPTCSGKTTTAEKLIKDLSLIERDTRVISIDDFFKDRGERQLKPNEKVDYDTIDALDFEYLSYCVSALYKGTITALPKYDFKTGVRTSYSDFTMSERDILIFEGIQAVYPEITQLFKNYNYKSVFINVYDDMLVNGVHFDRNDIRFLRRLVRDFKFRGASPEFTFFIWESVRANENKNILPYEDKSDVRINSSLPYELFLIKSYALPLLDTIGKESQYYEGAKILKDKFRELDTISEEYVPKNSIYREFLG